jgi:choline dehydrogenase-like flavoprotein
MAELAPEGPRAINGRAPDVFRPDGWVPMRSHSDDDEVDFAIVGTGAGGGTLACKLAEAGFSVVAFDAGPFWRPLQDFASDEEEQEKLYWNDTRLVAGEDPVQLGSNNSGKAVGGSTVHFAMVSLRFRPEWFKARTRLGYGIDWPLDWDDLEPYYREVEQALAISGPVSYPWGPPRPPYPRRPHPLNAAATVMARGAEAMGIPWCETPLATLSSPRGMAPPCVYRGMCVIGCSTNAKQSALVTWIPRALAAGAEIRDLAMVARIELDSSGRASALVYHRQGAWRRQKARNVIVAGYAIETPRLLLNSASPRHPCGLANGNGLVGTHFMVHSNDGVYGTVDEEVRWYKAPPSLAITEHWNYCDGDKDFTGGYCFMSQGPLPRAWARSQANNRGLWGMRLREEMAKYNFQAGLKMVGEVEPRHENRVALAEQRDDLGLPVAKVTFSYSDNDKRLKRHAQHSMRRMLEAAGARDMWVEIDTAHLVGGCRMGDTPETSVVNRDCRAWEIANLWICDGSVFPMSGGVNPSLTIQALACRTADRIRHCLGAQR